MHRSGRIVPLVTATLVGATALFVSAAPTGAQAFPEADYVTTVLTCDHVVGTGRVSSPGNGFAAIAKAAAPARMSPEWLDPTTSTSTDSAPGYVAPCSGSFSTPGGPDVGDLASMQLRLRGRENCDPSRGYGVDQNQYSASGTATFRFTNSNAGGKRYQSTASVVIGFDSDPSGFFDVVTVSGLVYGGVARGAIISAKTIWHTTRTATGPVPAPVSALDLTPSFGAVVPGDESLIAVINCVAFSGPALRESVWGTDGVSLSGTPFDSEFTFSLPSTAAGAASISPVRVPATTVLTCDNVAGWKDPTLSYQSGGAFTPTLTNVAPPRIAATPWTRLTTRAKLFRSSMTDQPSVPCTNSPAANDDYASIVGDLVEVKATLKGRENCNPDDKYTIDADQYPLTGSATFTFTNLDASSRPYELKAYVVVGPAKDTDATTLPEAVTVSGIVHRGVAKGALVSATLLEQPTRSGPTIFSPASILSSGVILPGSGSRDAALSCAATGSPPLHHVLWGTDGGGLLETGGLDSEFTLELPQ